MLQSQLDLPGWHGVAVATQVLDNEVQKNIFQKAVREGNVTD